MLLCYDYIWAGSAGLADFMIWLKCYDCYERLWWHWHWWRLRPPKDRGGAAGMKENQKFALFCCVGGVALAWVVSLWMERVVTSHTVGINTYVSHCEKDDFGVLCGQTNWPEKPCMKREGFEVRQSRQGNRMASLSLFQERHIGPEKKCKILGKLGYFRGQN